MTTLNLLKCTAYRRRNHPFLRVWPNSLKWRHGLAGGEHRLVRCLSVTLIGLALALAYFHIGSA